ncbi:DUF2313 domain-containing protein [Aneurinibacillus sp. Ricciae_BoGa-3]|uniref:putative phage tail protein n=1 Tax=Aneurinibacillus sp. Ricciae_BoGa-3 TaxID=3022697 RepID=UPI0023417A0C|nr:putative phage tail protein [Aneurinibacillus sp. Ricciae_BoGa-3]WCK55439.1 DUF2313 domain-containing protein [Aneurinibacillus sp. Ricciae_BoGa-3]
MDENISMLDYIRTLWPDVPDYFGDTENDTTLRKKLSVLAKTFENNETMIEQAFDEIFARTSSALLERWEITVGLNTATGQPDANRQARILGKTRGSGTTTPALIQSVAEAYSNGEVQVIEYPAEYRFVVKFTGTRGVPPNLDDLKKALQEIKQAHLVMEFAFTYTVWSELKATTWGNLKNYTWDDVKTRRWS